jgi:hypothetical protein
MILKVESYNAGQDFHVCRTEDGKIERVDLRTDNSSVGRAESLVGKTVEVDYIFPHISIASGVKVLDGRPT